MLPSTSGSKRRRSRTGASLTRHLTGAGAGVLGVMSSVTAGGGGSSRIVVGWAILGGVPAGDASATSGLAFAAPKAQTSLLERPAYYCSCGRRGSSARSKRHRMPATQIVTAATGCSSLGLGDSSTVRRRKNRSSSFDSCTGPSTAASREGAFVGSSSAGVSRFKAGFRGHDSDKGRGRRRQDTSLLATRTTTTPSTTAPTDDDEQSSLQSGVADSNLSPKSSIQVYRDVSVEEPSDDPRAAVALKKRPSRTARRLIAATASMNASASSMKEIHSEARPTTGGGRSRGNRNDAGDEDLTFWQGAPRASSDELYNLNMHLAAYAKDAQWEMAISLLKQMRARSSSHPSAATATNSISSNDATGGNAKADTGDVETLGVETKVASLDKKTSLMIQSGVEPNVVSYNNVITACANAKKQKRAEGIFREMTKDRGLRPNVFTYGALISACAKRGNWEDAVKYLEGMRDAGLAPNAVIYSTVISACERSDQWQRAVSLLRTMRQDGILPVTVTYNTVISACGKSGQWQKAVSLLDEMLELGAPPDMVTFASAMLACDRAKQWHQVLRIMDQMEEEGVLMDKYAYTTAIHAAAQLGKWTRTVRYLDDMGAHGVKKDVVTFSAAINACAQKGQWAQAEKLMQDMLESGLTPNVVTYTTLMVVLRKGGQYEKAISTLDLMRSKGVKPNVRSYSVAVAACADAKEWRRALSLMKEMEDKGVQPNTVTYNTAIRACGNAGALQEALNLVDEMEDKGVKLTVATYGSAVSACQRQGHWEMALQLLAKMRRDQMEPNEIVYMGVIKTCCAGGQSKMALELLSRMIDLRMRPTTHCFNAVITALTESDQLQEALRVLSMLKTRRNCTVNVHSYTPVLGALTRELRWQESILLFQEMENRKITPTVQSYTSVVRACERAGQYDTALKLLDEMRKRRMRFYDIGILDELFKRLLAAVALLRGRGAGADKRASSPPLHGNNEGGLHGRRGDGGGDRAPGLRRRGTADTGAVDIGGEGCTDGGGNTPPMADWVIRRRRSS